MSFITEERFFDKFDACSQRLQKENIHPVNNIITDKLFELLINVRWFSFLKHKFIIGVESFYGFRRN